MSKLRYRLLLGLYPDRWRERYGEEFLDLLQECRLSWGDTFDIVFRSLEERITLLLRGEQLATRDHAASSTLLRRGIPIAALFSAGLMVYSLFLIRVSLDRMTLLGALLISILLALYGFAGLSISQGKRKPGVLSGARCGVVTGAVYAAFLVIANLVPLDQSAGDLLRNALLPVLPVLWTIAGLLGSFKTGQLSAGMRAGMWAALIAALMGTVTVLFITCTFLNILNQNTLNYAGYLHSGMKDVTVFNIQDTLGGCFFTLLLAPFHGVLLGTIGALIGKVRSFHLFRV